jgi:AcrR family transcriptional regulator
MSAKKAYHHGNLRATLIETGLQLIASKGLAALTLREIGAHAGVSRMAAYRHFSNKSELIAAIREVGFTKFGDALQQASDKADSGFVPRMAAMALAYVAFARKHAAYFEVMFETDNPAERAVTSAAGDRAFHVLEQVIADGQGTGEVRSGDPKLLACAAWGLVHGIGALHLEQRYAGGYDTPADFVTACTGLLLTGLLTKTQ